MKNFERHAIKTYCDEATCWEVELVHDENLEDMSA